MTDLGTWETLNVLCRLGVALVVIVKLTRFHDHYKREERFGLGVLGGCSLMTIPGIIEGASSPFSEWAGTLFAFGVLVYLGGRLRRHLRHERANAKMVRQSRERSDR